MGVTVTDRHIPTTKGAMSYMHAQGLVAVHALGLHQREKNGNPDDDFKETQMLRDKTKVLLNKIMDKKSKQQYESYGLFCQYHFKVDTIKLLIPNETHMSGVLQCINQRFFLVS